MICIGDTSAKRGHAQDEALRASEVTRDRGQKGIPGGSDGTQGQPSHISRKRI